MPDLNEKLLQIAANEVKRASEVISKMVSDTVDFYCKELDELVYKVKLLLESDEDFTIQELESIALKIPIYLYSLSSTQEYVGIKLDASKQIQADKYNKCYIVQAGNNSVKEAAASSQTYSESIIKIVNARAYKVIESKVEAAYELLHSVKKVIIRRTEALNRGEE